MGASVFLMSLRAQRGNLVTYSEGVRAHRVGYFGEIATSLRSSQ